MYAMLHTPAAAIFVTAADVEMPGDEVDAAVQTLYTASEDGSLTEQLAGAGGRRSGTLAPARWPLLLLACCAADHPPSAIA